MVELGVNGLESESNLISPVRLLEGVTVIDDFQASRPAVQAVHENAGTLAREI